MSDQNSKQRTRYVSVRLTEAEADALWAAAAAGEIEASEVTHANTDGKPGEAARFDAALTRAMAKLRSATPRTRKPVQS